MKPFQDDKGSLSIGDLTAENGTGVVALSGSVEITRDKVGLKRAQALKALADALVAQLEDGDLPDKAAQDTKPADEVANPFA